MATGYAWTDGEISRLAELWDTGASYATIAETLGKTASAVQSKAAFVRLPRRRWPQAQHATAGFRSCMCCGDHFYSEWFGNRLCVPCKNS